MPALSVAALAREVREAPARLGSTRLVLIDGPAGSGKTTLAGALSEALGTPASAGAGTFAPSPATASAGPTVDPTSASALSPVQTLHGDDMYEGWGGLDTLDHVLVEQVLTPLSHGEAGAFRMWDWHQSRRTHTIMVPVRDVLIVEGVGVGRRRAREHASLLWWVEAPPDLRLARGIARDGEEMRAEWLRWTEVERAHFERDGTRAAATRIIDGDSPLAP